MGVQPIVNHLGQRQTLEIDTVSGQIEPGCCTLFPADALGCEHQELEIVFRRILCIWFAVVLIDQKPCDAALEHAKNHLSAA